MNTIPRENQIKIVITFVIVAIIITVLVIFREQLFRINNNITDNERFFKEYNGVPVDNVFKYVSVRDSVELFKQEEAIIFFGFKECSWCQSYAPILNEYAKENDVETIYYVDIKQDRANNTEEYKTLINLLKDYLHTDDSGNKRIYVPDVYFVKQGKIVGHNNDTSTEQGADIDGYYAEKGNELREKISDLFDKLLTTCDDSKKGC